VSLIYSANTTSSSSTSSLYKSAIFDLYDSSANNSCSNSPHATLNKSPTGSTLNTTPQSPPLISLQSRFESALHQAAATSSTTTTNHQSIKPPLCRQNSLPTAHFTQSIRAEDSLKRLNSFRVTQAQLNLRRCHSSGDDEVRRSVTTTKVEIEEEVEEGGGANGPYDLSLSPPTKRILMSGHHSDEDLLFDR
jgi:hypothetical protein